VTLRKVSGSLVQAADIDRSRQRCALIDLLRTGREQPKSTRVIEPLLAEMAQNEIDKKHLARHAGPPTTCRRTTAA
jgi:hypothetical protein